MLVSFVHCWNYYLLLQTGKATGVAAANGGASAEEMDDDDEEDDDDDGDE